MANQHKTFADAVVLTAEEVNDYLMDQVIVKVDDSTGLTTLPTTVKTAYVLNTGILMARDDLNDWYPAGGTATVDTTAPSNPQTGAIWVNPDKVLPLPARGRVQSGQVNVTATSWTDYTSDPLSFTTDYDVMCMVTLLVWTESAASTQVRVRLAWTGDLAGDSTTLMSGYPGSVLNETGGGRMSGNIAIPMVIPAGTTTFAIEAQKSGSNTPQVEYAYVHVVPLAFADQYEAGVS